MANVVKKEKKDFITDHDVMLVDLDSGEKIHFQGLPNTLDINPNTEWATIRPFGRNNPHYHFTGSEDEIQFEVSWYAEKEDKSDVIEKCKWVESLSRADGYTGRPHIVGLIWGDLYRKQKFIMFSAPYRLALFDAEKGYKPTVATQIITLKRVTDKNLSLKQILDWR